MGNTCIKCNDESSMSIAIDELDDGEMDAVDNKILQRISVSNEESTAFNERSHDLKEIKLPSKELLTEHFPENTDTSHLPQTEEKSLISNDIPNNDETESEPAYILQLPEMILEVIFKNLTLNELSVNIRPTCKAFHVVASRILRLTFKSILPRLEAAMAQVDTKTDKWSRGCTGFLTFKLLESELLTLRAACARQKKDAVEETEEADWSKKNPDSNMALECAFELVCPKSSCPFGIKLLQTSEMAKEQENNQLNACATEGCHLNENNENCCNRRSKSEEILHQTSHVCEGVEELSTLQSEEYKFKMNLRLWHPESHVPEGQNKEYHISVKEACVKNNIGEHECLLDISGETVL